MGEIKPGYVKASVSVLSKQLEYLNKNHINKSILSRRLLDKYLRSGCQGNTFKRSDNTEKISIVIRKDQLEILESRAINKSELMKDLIHEWMTEQGL